MTSPRPIIVIVMLLSLAGYYFMRLTSTTPELGFDNGIEAVSPQAGETVVQALPQPAARADTPFATEVQPPQVAQPQVAADTVSIGGWVGDRSGNGLADIVIEVESSGFDGEQITTTKSVSNQRGEFLLQGMVPDRQYKLEIKPTGGYAGFQLDAFNASKAARLRQIILQRIDLVDIDGMIVDINHAPVADFELSVRSLSSVFPDRTIRSDSSGFFKLNEFPAGEIRIASNASDYYRIKGLSLARDEYHNLTLVIDRGSYHLSGWVSDDNGAPISQAQVTVKSAFTLDDYHSFSYRSRITDANGAFEFSDLGGHQLTLGVYASGFKTHVQRHDFESFADALQIRLLR